MSRLDFEQWQTGGNTVLGHFADKNEAVKRYLGLAANLFDTLLAKSPEKAAKGRYLTEFYSQTLPFPIKASEILPSDNPLYYLFQAMKGVTEERVEDDLLIGVVRSRVTGLIESITDRSYRLILVLQEATKPRVDFIMHPDKVQIKFDSSQAPKIDLKDPSEPIRRFMDEPFNMARVIHIIARSTNKRMEIPAAEGSIGPEPYRLGGFPLSMIDIMTYTPRF